MIEDVERVEAELKLHPIQSLDKMDVFVESDIRFLVNNLPPTPGFSRNCAF